MISGRFDTFRLIFVEILGTRWVHNVKIANIVYYGNGTRNTMSGYPTWNPKSKIEGDRVVSEKQTNMGNSSSNPCKELGFEGKVIGTAELNELWTKFPTQHFGKK